MRIATDGDGAEEVGGDLPTYPRRSHGHRGSSSLREEGGGNLGLDANGVKETCTHQS